MDKWWPGHLTALLFYIAYTIASLPGSKAQSCESGSIRLNQTGSLVSPADNVGRVELCVAGEWGTLALQDQADFWSDKNIQVACRQLNFSGGLNSIPPSHIPDEAKSPSDLLIHYTRVVCLGEEEALSSCSMNQYRGQGGQTSPSDHHTDVFIVCRPRERDYSALHVAGEQIGDVRLFGHQNSGRGAVEILTSVGWTAVCPVGWTNSYARIICQTLGYDVGVAESVELNSTISRSVYDANCSETLPTTSLSSRVQGGVCSFLSVAQPEDCSVSSDLFAGVVCGARSTSVNNPVRFFGNGRFDSTRAVGVVEIFMDQRWGMVCDREPENVSQINAEFLCSQFFVNPMMDAKTVRIPLSSLRRYESHLKPMWSDGLVCPSSITDVSGCVFEEPLGFSDCSSGHILALDCGSTVVQREGNMTAIIVGILVTVFIFVLAVLIFAKVFWIMFRKRRDVVAINTNAYPLSVGGADPQDHQAAINACYDDEAKLADNTSHGDEKEDVGGSREKTSSLNA